LVLIRPQFFKF